MKRIYEVEFPMPLHAYRFKAIFEIDDRKSEVGRVIVETEIEEDVVIDERITVVERP